MKRDLFERLKKDYRDRANQFALIIGSGLSIAATDNKEVASWVGLIRSGVTFCTEHQLVTEEWKTIRLMQLGSEDLSEMLTASEHITEKLGGRAGRDYRDWLGETVGELENGIVNGELGNAIAGIDATVLTTNYDGILEKVTGLPAITWQDRFELDDELRGKSGRRIIHLHGHWKKPESVILGIRSYDEILRDAPAQQALKNFFGTRTFILIGTAVSGGLSDPNFDAFRKWIISNYSHAALHYVFVRESDAENAREQLPLQGRILPIAYQDHSDLPNLLEELTDVRPSPISVRVVQQETAIERYLYQVRRFCRRLPNEDTHRNNCGKTLDELYIPAKLRTTNSSAQDAEPCTRAGPPLGVAEALEWAATEGHRHVAIVGEAGIGKSTLLRHLASLAWDRPEAIGLPRRHLPLLIRAKGLPGDMRYPEARLQAASETLGAKLPDGFLADWSREAQAPWLILFDALDEVPNAPLDDPRADVINFVFELVLEESSNAPRCILSSRPGCDTSFEALFKRCIHFEMLPLTASAQGELSEKLVGKESSEFLRQFDSLRIGSAGNTPLLTTLAAQLYLESRRLPRSRAQLYKQYVGSCINVDQKEALFHEVDPRLWKYGDRVLPILENLAFSLTSGATRPQKSTAIDAVATVIADLLGESSAHAKLIAGHLMGVLTRRTGLLRDVGDEIEWSHQTIRDYLAACALRREPLSVIRSAVGKWEEDNWTDTIVFLFTIGDPRSPERALPTSELLEEILAAERDDLRAYMFVAHLIAEGTAASPELKERVINAVKTVALHGGKLDYCRSVYAEWSKTGRSPTDLLRRMLPHPLAELALLEIVTSDVGFWQKENAIRACVEGRIVEPLQKLLLLPGLDESVKEILRSATSHRHSHETEPPAGGKRA